MDFHFLVMEKQVEKEGAPCIQYLLLLSGTVYQQSLADVVHTDIPAEA